MKKIVFILLIAEMATCFSYSQNTDSINDFSKLEIQRTINYLTETDIGFAEVIVKSFAGTNKPITEWDYELKGNIKSITEKEFELVDKFGTTNEILQSIIFSFFDNYGNETTKDYWSIGATDTLGDKWTYKYNDKGNIIEVNWYHKNKSIKYYFINKWINKYDEKDKMIEESIYASDSTLTNKCIYKYNNKNNLEEYLVYDSNGSLRLKLNYIYNDEGNLIENDVSDGSGNLFYKYTFKYNEKGNWIEVISSNSISLHDKHTYAYNDNGDTTEVIYYKMYGALEMTYKRTYIYDDKENIIEKSYYETRNPDFNNLFEVNKWTYKYDDKGNIIEKNYYELGATGLYNKDTYKYSYDDIGNWIKQTIVTKSGQNGLETLGNITKREIKYY